ncbi:hypothetical protein M569_04088, partial [Genlisea aurea]
DLFEFLAFDDLGKGAKFLETGEEGGLPIALGKLFGHDSGAAHRWVIVVSIIARKIIKFFGRPLKWTGNFMEFVLNLLSLNGDFLGLVYRFVQGNVVMPIRDSETFISAIGHIDGRINLLLLDRGETWELEMGGDQVLMDLCIMASKLAYENAKVVRNVMHFVGFYNCWNDYQREMSTQVFIMCDKPADASLILVSFRGTEPFDADDWITDFDYSWYEIRELGKVHMGFIEALGLGNRSNTTTFEQNLAAKDPKPMILNLSEAKTKLAANLKLAPDSEDDDPFPFTEQLTAYYAVKNKLNGLLEEHRHSKIVVTGHSLGGALAILFPTVLLLHKEDRIMRRLQGVYTFGQPRVGDAELARYLETHLGRHKCSYFRAVYCNDLVPRLPYDDKTFLYKHFGRCLYYNSLYVEQDVDEEPNRNYFGLRYVVPEYLNAAWEVFRSLTIGKILGPVYRESWECFVLRLVGLVIPGLSDHATVDYVNSIRLGK